MKFVRVGVGFFLLWALMALVFSHVVFGQAWQPGSDFNAHTRVAESGNTGTHPLFAWCTQFVANLFEVDFMWSGCLVALVALVISSTVTAWRLWQHNRRCGWWAVGVTIASAFTLILCGPINVFTAHVPNVYMGYHFVTVFHNPTLMLCQPMSYLLFWLYLITTDKLTCCDDEKEKSRGSYKLIGQFVALVTLSTLSTLAKPNFALCFVPAVWCIVVFQFFVDRKSWKWSQFYAACCATFPAVGVLLNQLLVYHDSTTGSRMVFEFLGMLRDPPLVAFMKVLASFAFPLCVVALFPRRSLKSPPVRLALVTFGIAFATYLCFVEQGPRRWAGNFSWGTKLAGYLLFVEAFCVFRDEVVESCENQSIDFRQLRKILACLVVLIAHAVCGISYVALHYRQQMDVPNFW